MSDVVLIWWTDHAAAKATKRTISMDSWSPTRHERWPIYLTQQFESRLGRAGRGRLWNSGGFGQVEVADACFSTPIGNWITEAGMAGIVIGRRDLPCVIGLPGVVTDTELKRVWEDELQITKRSGRRGEERRRDVSRET